MADNHPRPKRLIIVSNRLPIVLMQHSDGQWRAEGAAGGLVNALRPVLQARGGVWIGWPGTVSEVHVPEMDRVLARAAANTGYAYAPVPLTAHERDAFYLGFSNEIIWPLFHDLQTRCNFDPAYWTVYEQVNRTFAQNVAAHALSDDEIWVHDYHLMLVAHHLRLSRWTTRLSFFLHIPFPPPDIFLKLPWRTAILRGLLAHDRVGVQTRRDRDNLVACMYALMSDFAFRETSDAVSVTVDDRTVTIGHFPISIDAQELARQSGTAEVKAMASMIRQTLPDQHVLLGVDRLDYTKGIPQKLLAFREALRRFPDLRRRVTLTQIAVPSRTDIPQYGSLRSDIEQLVGAINGEFTESGWIPIRYIARRVSFIELLAYYLIADMALVTPVKDGMNLVAKEYVTCNSGDGVLILSEFAGAADQFREGALLCNPYDRVGLAETIHYATQLSRTERRTRMDTLSRSVVKDDIYKWVDTFLGMANEV